MVRNENPDCVGKKNPATLVGKKESCHVGRKIKARERGGKRINPPPRSRQGLRPCLHSAGVIVGIGWGKRHVATDRRGIIPRLALGGDYAPPSLGRGYSGNRMGKEGVHVRIGGAKTIQDRTGQDKTGRDGG